MTVVDHTVLVLPFFPLSSPAAGLASVRCRARMIRAQHSCEVDLKMGITTLAIPKPVRFQANAFCEQCAKSDSVPDRPTRATLGVHPESGNSLDLQQLWWLTTINLTRVGRAEDGRMEQRRTGRVSWPRSASLRRFLRRICHMFPPSALRCAGRLSSRRRWHGHHGMLYCPG